MEASNPAQILRIPRQWTILILVGLALMVYFPSLGNGFVNYDDIDERIFKNPFLHQPWQWSFIPTAFSQATAGYYDPIYVLSYVVDYQLWGMNPAGFHFDNLVLHVLNTLLVLAVLFRMTGRFELAWIAAMIFALHPVHVESVSWATSRKDTLSLFWVLSAFWVYWRYREGSGRQFTLAVMGATVLFLLGLMTKPPVAVFPGMVLMADLLFGTRPHSWKRILGFQLLAWSVCLGFIAATYSMTVGIAVKETIHFTPVQQVSLFFELYAYFLKLILFPVNLSALYLIPIHDQFEPVTLFAVIPLLLFMVGWLFWEIARAVKDEARAQQHGTILWGASIFFGGLLPYTNIMPRTIYLADRYEYLASIGFALIVAEMILRLPKAVWRNGVFGTLIFLYAILTWNRVPVWRDSVTLWSDVHRKMVISPEASHLRMAHAYAFQGQWQQALKEYEQVDLVAMRDPETWLRVGRLYFTAGQIKPARDIFQKLVDACPQYPISISYLMMLNISQDQGEKTFELLKRFEPVFSPEEQNYIRQSLALQKMGKHQEAAGMLRQLNQSLDKRLAPVRSSLVQQCRDNL